MYRKTAPNRSSSQRRHNRSGQNLRWQQQTANMGKENKRPRKSWTVESENTLIDLWEEKIEDLRGIRKNSHVYKEMAVELQQLGFDLNSAEIKIKIDNLTAKYRKCNADACLSDVSPIDWVHYDRVHHIIGGFRPNKMEIVMEESIIGPDPLPAVTQADSDKQLFSLLCEIDKYNYLYIFERCKACNVNARQLKYLEKEHLRELVPKINLGVQAEFEYLFKEWKVKNGYLTSSDPFMATATLSTPANDRSNNVTPTQARQTNAAHNASHLLPEDDGYEVPMTYHDEEDSQASFSVSDSHTSMDDENCKPKKQYLLNQIIPTVLKKCQQKYKANRSLLTEVERRLLSSAIVDYFLSRNIHLNSSTIDNLAEQIATHFPTESKRSWYDRRNNKGQGRLYAKLYNSQRRKEKSRNSKKLIKKPSTQPRYSHPIPTDEDESMDEESNTEMEGIKNWLKTNKCENIDEVINMWRNSLNYRQRQLRNIANSPDGFTNLINDWPAYTWPTGHYLLNIDFNHLYPNSEAALHERWSVYMQKISNLFEAELKDNANLELFKQFKRAGDGINIDSKQAILLQLLHAITKPSRCFNTPDGARRYSIAESQSSVMKLIANVSDLDSVAEPHPCIYLIGESILSVERCVVAYRDIQYELSLEDALCACLQFYMVFQLEFPPASLNFWSFVRGYFFDINSDSDSSYAVMDNIIQYLGTYEA